MSEKKNTNGIDFSVAARLVENAFRKELGYDDDDIANLSGDDELERHCDEDSLDAVRECIRTNGQRGLPSLKPPHTILREVIEQVGLGDTIATLAVTVSDNAFPTQKRKAKGSRP